MTIPASIVVDLTASTETVFAGVLPLLIILFGIAIAFFVVRSLVNLIPKG